MLGIFYNKKVLSVLTVLIILFIFVLRLSSAPSSKDIVVNFQNTESVVLFDITDSSHGDVILKEQINESGQSVKIEEGLSYIINYMGAPGYEDGSIPLNYTYGEKELVIEPFFARERLNGLLKGQLDEINDVIKKKYPKINLYKIRKGALFRFGEWYGATLVYKGEYSFHSDTLRIILHSENGKWMVKTDPPSIVFYKNDYKDIPESVLREVNALPVPETELE